MRSTHQIGRPGAFPRIVQQIGKSPFPEIKHFTSKICGVEAPKETQNVKRSTSR